MRFSVLISAAALMGISTVLASPAVEGSTPTKTVTVTATATCTSSAKLNNLLITLNNILGNENAGVESMMGNANNIIGETTNTAVEQEANDILGTALTTRSSINKALAVIQSIALLLGAKL